MTIALWIIAVVETIRMVEQSLQLRLIAKDTKDRGGVYEEFVKTLRATDEEIVDSVLEAWQAERTK